jgi:hypothetical protein
MKNVHKEAKQDLHSQEEKLHAWVLYIVKLENC